MSINLGLLTDSTSIHVVLNKGVYSWPPIIVLYQVHCPQVSGMACRQGIVVTSHHIPLKFLIIRYIASILVEHEVVFCFLI